MDIDILLALQALRESMTPALGAVFEVLRRLGEATALMAVASVLLWGVDKRAGFFVLFNSAWGLLINQFIKITACVYRPWIRDSRVKPAESAIATATGYSFPSAHTTLSIAMWAGTGAGLTKRRKWAVWLGIAVSALVAFSRMFVGVHTPQDVFVSAAIGIILMCASFKIRVWLDENPSRDVYIFILGLFTAAVLAVYAATKSYPMDYVNGALLVDPSDMINDAYMTVGVASGFFAGWFIERRFIKYSVEGGVITRIVRVIIGFIGLLTLNKFLPGAFQIFGKEMAQILATMVLVLYATAIYPLIFIKVEKMIFRDRRQTTEKRYI